MADKRVRYDPQEKELWFKARCAGDSITKIAETFGVPVGTVSLNCKRAGVERGGTLPTPEPQVESKEDKEPQVEPGGAAEVGDSSGEFAELEEAFKGVQEAVVAFVQKRHQELLTQNAELMSRLTESKEECKKLKEAVLEERNGNGDWKERLQSF